MKQIVSNYSYSPTTNVVTLTGVNIDQDQLLLVVAPQVGRTMYNFASVTGTVSAGADTRVTLNASTAGLTTTSPLVIFYDDQASTQTVAGAVTANVIGTYQDENQFEIFDRGIGLAYSATLTDDGLPHVVAESKPLPVKLWASTVTIGNSVTIGSLPAISGTVTVGGFSSVSVGSGAVLFGGLRSGNVTPIPLETSSGFLGAQLVQSTGAAMGPINASNRLPVTAQLQDGSGNNLTSTSIGGVQRLNVSLASAATAGGTLPSFINIHGGTDGSVARTMLLDSSGRTVVTVSNFPATQPVSLASTTVTVSSLPNVTIGNSVTIASIPAISGTVAISSLPNVNLAGGNVIAVSNFPATQPVSGTVTANSSNGSLTTRFGTPTTANVSFATAAVTKSDRKYLLIQNVTTGSNVITVGIGFTPTTTQGIQLTAGAGITFESSYIPTGAVYVLSSVTASNFTILEA